MALRCRWCGIREFIFRDNPVKQFVDFVTRPRKSFKQIICIAHNASAFDAEFILRYLVESGNRVEPKLILNGTKIILLTIGQTKFIDSVNYMPMRLSALPKAFGLKDTAGKGLFPHLFNTVENQHYIGPIPDARYYSPETMRPSERERFLEWHEDMVRKNIEFDFQREIVSYCRNDIDILRRACFAFRKIFLDRGKVCPFEECTTIASTCMRVFRKNFLREKEIGIIPSGGYRRVNNQSRKALKWLLWMEHELGHTITHAGKSREHRIPEGLLVDGYYETTNPAQRHVLQFHGCFWHGCPACFKVSRDTPLSTTVKGDTIESRYEHIRVTTSRLQKLGYIVTKKWACVFDRELQDNQPIYDFLANHSMLETEPLDPRKAFFGGRTGNIVTRCDVAGTEKIRYVDVCSLYPFVLKTGSFPLGRPDVYVGEECFALIGIAPDFDFSRVEGIVRCKVLAPRDLFHPVLPFRVRGKLLFALCRSCSETFSQSPCTQYAQR
ncbi:uncharacterized protein LOC112589908 [Harpegnathos saltator]|uniref:uncharacterized protein LOC112589908 n=1 Tax=Harpegnathos saltator TaxID=610380 RepID=UPI000DBEDC46|nr:uncharacterized protein LOC112589908 [Harpegnathos saltator]